MQTPSPFAVLYKEKGIGPISHLAFSSKRVLVVGCRGANIWDLSGEPLSNAAFAVYIGYIAKNPSASSHYASRIAISQEEGSTRTDLPRKVQQSLVCIELGSVNAEKQKYPLENGKDMKQQERKLNAIITPSRSFVLSSQKELFPASDFTQRWRERKHSWRHISEGGFNQADYEIAAIPDDTTARAFVCTHHYSGTYPAARLRYGLYTRDGLLIGVAVLSVPSQAKVLTSVFPELAPYNESLELGRFVLLDSAPANSESHFLSHVWKQASCEGIQGIVSFSDPVARANAAGEIVFGGHIGTIYQASNALYLGRSTQRTLTVLPDGHVFNDRAMQKVRGQEQGADYSERKLVMCGARPRTNGEDPRLWLRQVLSEIGARQIPHPGNHRYAFRIGKWRKFIRIGLAPQAYPKMTP